MINRRDFLKGGLAFAEAMGIAGVIPPVVARAYAITPAPGTSYLDAEHVVVLMQENRSFDHMFGTLRGVRGFNDPRALRQADGTSIFLQRDRDGNAYLPWHVSIKDTRATWMGSLPHNRDDQIDAWNGGAHNNWIEAKRYRNKEYEHIPGTMGFCTRDDIPFYYALADAFTVCDQNYCSIMTGTAPNRLMMWSGTVRENHDTDTLVYLRNEQTHPGALAWTSYGERLQRAGISWKCYQNQLWCEGSLDPEAELWLGNYGDNSHERFQAYPLAFAPWYRDYVKGVIDEAQANLLARQAEIRQEHARLEPGSPEARRIEALLGAYARQLERLEAKRSWGRSSLSELSAAQLELRSRGLQINSGDPDFEKLTQIAVELDGGTDYISVPKGDVLYQFRKDVRENKLPTVSWLVAAGNFSDHPARPWYGAWYVSEVLKILTENPDFWKKTIFILTYDENDGYFDHSPPYVAADPNRHETGGASAGIDVGQEYCSLQDELLQGVPPDQARAGPTGLGYRVPMIIASPWSRGGWVNSEVCDHTSILRFLETFLEKKYGKSVIETNISAWRRVVCGNLESNFRRFDSDPPELAFLDRNSHLEAITRAQDKPVPAAFTKLNGAEITALGNDPARIRSMLWQEPGIRPSCALPYELYADGAFDDSGKRAFQLRLEASTRQFGDGAAGAAFNVYLYGVATGFQTYAVGGIPNTMAAASYAVRAGDTLVEEIALSRFTSDTYDIAVHGPNGFYRHFFGNKASQPIRIDCGYHSDPSTPSAFRIRLVIENRSRKKRAIVVQSHYDEERTAVTLSPHQSRTLFLDIARHHHWYDFSVISRDTDFAWRYAGRVEIGAPSVTDPAMGDPARKKSEA